ncbi:hypothetical protein HNP00_003934 [Arthrobacter sp. AZCC_0090]|nr:hypothetical protein [Arthrobacter sp. AZCC_0090]
MVMNFAEGVRGVSPKRSYRNMEAITAEIISHGRNSAAVAGNTVRLAWLP